MNKHGINFDIGLPLEEQEEFDILYVDWLPEQTGRLQDWLKDEIATPVAVTGQIGCGKTTFIRKAFAETQIKPDINLRLDKIPNISQGSFYGVFLYELLNLASQKSIDLSVYGFNVFFDKEINTIDDFINILKPNINIEILKRQEKIFNKIDKDIHLLKEPLTDLCKKIEKVNNRKLFIYVEGIDKFHTNTAEYKLAVGLLNFLSKYKILFETNMVHVFCNDEWRLNAEQIILTSASDKTIREMLKKRLGIYAVDFKDYISKIYKRSGGNFRQALRLLTTYEYAIRKVEKYKTKALEYAEKIVRQDLLTTESKDIDILKLVVNNNEISDNTFVHEKGAIDALFGNQIFITEEKNKQNKWQTIINPLLEETVKYHKEKIDEKIDENYLQLAKFKLQKVFNTLSSYFLNKGKNEINVIINSNIEIAKIINDYLVGRAGAYEEICYNDTDISNSNMKELIFRKELNEFDGISCFFSEKLNDENIKLLELNRNRLIEKNMIWWIDQKHIAEYINKWYHLRQFMHFYDLEDDIMQSIEIDDIEQDIEDLDLLDYDEKEKAVMRTRLEKVLNYIKANQNG